MKISVSNDRQTYSFSQEEISRMLREADPSPLEKALTSKNILEIVMDLGTGGEITWIISRKGSAMTMAEVNLPHLKREIKTIIPSLASPAKDFVEAYLSMLPDHVTGDATFEFPQGCVRYVSDTMGGSLYLPMGLDDLAAVA